MSPLSLPPVSFLHPHQTLYGSVTDCSDGALVAGDGISWSMGGPPDSGLASLAPGLLGAPKGISFSHNEYEGDGSATRNDFYLAYVTTLQYYF